jgi:hypothetical protein
MAADESLRIACANCGATFNCAFAGDGMTVVGTNLQQCPSCGHMNAIPSGLIGASKAHAPPAQPQRHLSFHKAKPYSHVDEDVLSGIKTHLLRIPVVAFLTNVRRLKRLQEMPSEISHVSAMLVTAAIQAGVKHDEEPSERHSTENRDFRQKRRTQPERGYDLARHAET